MTLETMLKSRPAFQNPDNKSEVWSGRGVRPQWVINALAAGRKPEELRAPPMEDTFKLYEECILSGQIPDHEVPKFLDARPDFKAWYAKRI